MTWEVIQGDCLDVLRGMESGSVDAVVTDPPYGVNAASWDSEIPPQIILDECLRIARGSVVWFGAARSRAVKGVLNYDPTPDRILIWHVTFSLAKTAAHGMFYRWHPIYVWRPPKNQGGIDVDVLEIPQNGHNEWNHPATKPPKLMRRLVKAFANGLVLDPFTGSGTTGVAAAIEGFDFIGIEREPHYCEVARRRIACADGEGLPLFQGVLS